MVENKLIPKELGDLKSSIYQEVLAQLEKDFLLSGLHPEWDITSRPEQFWQEFKEFLRTILAGEPEMLRAVLYRVDLNEEMLVKIHRLSTGNAAIEVLGKQLLIREIKKVMSRSVRGGDY